MNESKLPRKQFKDALNTGESIKQNLKPFIDEYLKQNMLWIFQSIQIIYQNLQQPSLNPQLKFNSLLAVLAIIQTCQYVPLLFIQTYIFPIIQIGAIADLQLSDSLRGSNFFRRPKSEIGQNWGQKYVRLCTEMVEVLSIIKPSFIFYETQVNDKSIYKITNEKIHKKLTYQLTPYNYFKNNVKNLQNQYKQKLSNFNDNNSQSYQTFIQHKFTQQIKNQFKEIVLDIRLLVNTADCFFFDLVTGTVTTMLKTAKQCKNIRIAINFINQLILSGNYRAKIYLNDAYQQIKKLIQEIIKIPGNKKSLDRGQQLFADRKEQKKGTAGQRYALYVDLLQNIQIWANVFTKQSINDSQKPSIIAKYYHKLKQQYGLQFPKNTQLINQIRQVEQNYEKLYNFNQKVKSQQIQSVQSAQNDSILLTTINNNSKSNEIINSQFILPNDQDLRQSEKIKQQYKDNKNMLYESIKQLIITGQKYLPNNMNNYENNYKIFDKFIDDNNIRTSYHDQNKICKSNHQQIQIIYQQYKENKINFNTFCKIINQQILKLQPFQKKNQHIYNSQISNSQMNKIIQSEDGSSDQNLHNKKSQKLKISSIQQKSSRKQQSSKKLKQHAKNPPQQKSPNQSKLSYTSKPNNQKEQQKEQQKKSQFIIQPKKKNEQQNNLSPFVLKNTQQNIYQKQQQKNKNNNRKLNYNNNPSQSRGKSCQPITNSKNQKIMSSQSISSPIKNLHSRSIIQSPNSGSKITVNDQIIQGHTLNPLKNSYHDSTSILQKSKSQNKSFKQAINNGQMLKPTKKQNYFLFQIQSTSLIRSKNKSVKKNDKINMQYNMQQILQQCNKQHQIKIQYVQQSKQLKIKQLQNKLTNMQQQFKIQSIQLKTLKQSSQIDQNRSKNIQKYNIIDDQAFLLKKLHQQNQHSKKYTYPLKQSKILTIGQLINTKIYEKYYNYIQDEKIKKIHLKNKQLIYKDNQLQIGYMSQFNNQQYQITCFITPQKQFILDDIIINKQDNIQVKHYFKPEVKVHISAKKQQKFIFFFFIKFIPYAIPQVTLIYRLENIKKTTKFYLPCAFHKFIIIQPEQQKLLSAFSTNNIIRGEQIPYNRKILKNINLIKDYLPHIDVINNVNDNGEICYGGRAVYDKQNSFYVKICIKPNQFLYIQSIDSKNIQCKKIIEFYIATLNHFFMKNIKWN